MNRSIKATIFKMLHARYRALRGVLAQMEEVLLTCEVTDPLDKETKEKLVRELWDRDVYHMQKKYSRKIFFGNSSEHQMSER